MTGFAKVETRLRCGPPNICIALFALRFSRLLVCDLYRISAVVTRLTRPEPLFVARSQLVVSR